MSERSATLGDGLAVVRDALRSDDRGRVGGTFMRGLTLGALLGAAIAGSAIWQRRAGQSRSHAAAGGTPR